MGGGKRQYMTAIFAHTEEQMEVASKSLHKIKEARNGRVSTVVEEATDFYLAEMYHQKWLLQRKDDWFKALALPDTESLLNSQAACKVNAFVAGHLSASALRDSLDKYAQTGKMNNDVWSSLRTRLKMDCIGDE
mmetsp:Transcript_4445/g.8930  ORF Transcript_4445/g.8930 Transcript_4445/m.8930 type:complete len:134 (+) Transcript_4445:514-915(+)